MPYPSINRSVRIQEERDRTNVHVLGRIAERGPDRRRVLAMGVLIVEMMRPYVLMPLAHVPGHLP